MRNKNSGSPRNPRTKSQQYASTVNMKNEVVNCKKEVSREGNKTTTRACVTVKAMKQ